MTLYDIIDELEKIHRNVEGSINFPVLINTGDREVSAERVFYTPDNKIIIE